MFQRLASGGIDRIVVADLLSSTTADLFDVFAAQQLGRRRRPSPTTARASRPAALHVDRVADEHVAVGLSRRPVLARHHRVRAQLRLRTGPESGSARLDHSPRRCRLGPGLWRAPPTRSSCTRRPRICASRRVDHVLRAPALDAKDGLVVYEHASNSLSPSSLRYRSSDPGTTTTIDTAFPSIVNAGGNTFQIHPAFTPDDRYLGFVRFSASNEFLYVFDTESQTLLNPDGIDLGAMQVFALASASPTGCEGLSRACRRCSRPRCRRGAADRHALNPSGIGILVQRIAATTLLGRTNLTLQPVGRVPLGKHGRGAFRIRWDHRVNGKPLRL